MEVGWPHRLPHADLEPVSFLRTLFPVVAVPDPAIHPARIGAP
jgi:hypothetical protein